MELMIRIRNILAGMGSVLDICPAPTVAPIGGPILERSDADALRSDWIQVGRSMSRAIGTMHESLTEDEREQIPVRFRRAEPDQRADPQQLDLFDVA